MDEHADRTLHSMLLCLMMAKAAQVKLLWKHEVVVTLEDHLLDGGFGSWLLEAKAKAMGSDFRCEVRPMAFRLVVCGTVGSQSTLNRLGCIIPESYA